MDKTRDGNHTVRYNFLVLQRLYRSHVKGEGDNTLAALSDVVNSLMRAALGFCVMVFTVSANLCKQLKKKCYRRVV